MAVGVTTVEGQDGYCGVKIRNSRRKSAYSAASRLFFNLTERLPQPLRLAAAGGRIRCNPADVLGGGSRVDGLIGKEMSRWA